jgi:molybdopterin-containing oxidoreductase family membrane subunit
MHFGPIDCVLEELSMNTRVGEEILKPLAERNTTLRIVTGGLAVSAGFWLFACLRVLSEGHTILGTESYGATWGLAVANVIHVIGISHVGIAISAAVRILRLDRYRNIARLAEIITLICLLVAVLNIALDVGRPDRFLISTLLHGSWHAPMVWSATVISLYFAASFVYLYLSMRRDLWMLSHTSLRFSGLYRMMSLGYRDTSHERERHRRTLFWLALALVPIMVSVHSVYGLFFGLLTGKAGWYNPLQAPSFVLGAVVSGVSALIVVAAILRRLYAWHDLIDDRSFRVLGGLLAFVVFLALYFVTSEHLTAQYAAAPADRAVSDALIRGEFAPIFWATILGGLFTPFVVLFQQAIRRASVRVGLVAVAAAAVNIAMLVKRVLLVVPAQLHSELPLPRPVVGYQPSLEELVITLGSYAVGGLLLVAALKTFPLVELPSSPAAPPIELPRISGFIRSGSVAVTIVVALVLVAWGIVTRNQDLAPIKWISGLILMTAVPLVSCLVRGGSSHPASAHETNRSTGG